MTHDQMAARAGPAGVACCPEDRTEQERTLRRAARALGRHGLVHAYGHCSLRVDADHFLVCAPKPLGTILPGEAGTLVSIQDALPPEVLGEVRIHREIYRRRPDIGGVVRSMPPKAMSLSVMGRTPTPTHGMGTYFSPGVPLWDDLQLIRSDDEAAAIAEQMGTTPAIVMRGNGVVVAAPSIEDAVVLTWYLEDSARIELDCLAAGIVPRRASAEEACKRATRGGRIFERMWDYLTHGDPE
jgi:HCOMODA/2-hydroxy-3-carboxy-muconic semialdehyde decarboxylase